jgi:choline dehydrogenase-like flavoprotein
MNAYDGLQISHYLQVAGELDFIFETWFNPPVAQALVMPGWLDTHFRNMNDYDRMVAMGVVVGTEASDNTYIRKAALFPGSPEVVYEPSPKDLDKLVNAMILMGRVLLASGAERVLASTRSYHSYTSGRAYYASDDDLGYLKQLVKEDADLLLSSAHPQGGNPLGTVLDPQFRVRGYRNLYVCDASVFPSALTVNPQLTVMNMAWYAGERIE